MNTLLAAPAARHKAVDVLFTSQSKTEIDPKDAKTSGDGEGRQDEGRSGSGSGSGFFGFKGDVSKLSVDVNTTQNLPASFVGNPTLFTVNLISRIAQSTEALWRNPVSARIAKWGRREVMHIFNGRFHQAIDGYERYETFGRCYTSPDPFRNDDPPWVACFCR